ncbi:hypothetical protein QTO34_007620 [Cnephaeus nilssonii]|uniref:Chorein N-terminal domain-containing protein n=1 Tax=Cnephaeus nilssonii TaxID=3371016 RepID=A0AA40HIT9_CNENI|nr:hypothetical protein QTO34_007620 [Eptesicus nilssonii]
MPARWTRANVVSGVLPLGRGKLHLLLPEQCTFGGGGPRVCGSVGGQQDFGWSGCWVAGSSKACLVGGADEFLEKAVLPFKMAPRTQDPGGFPLAAGRHPGPGLHSGPGFIQKDDDHESCGSNSTNPSTTENTKSSVKPRRIQQAAPTDPDLPPGYVQSLIRRVVNNVNIVINNLILKYVEDDIVLSVNITSAECYTVGELWDRAFMDISERLPPARSATPGGTPIREALRSAGGQRKTGAGGKLLPAATQSATTSVFRRPHGSFRSVGLTAAPEAFERPGAPADSQPGPPRSKAKAGDLAGCLLRRKAFRKPPQRRRLSEGLGHRRTASPLVHQVHD